LTTKIISNNWRNQVITLVMLKFSDVVQSSIEIIRMSCNQIFTFTDNLGRVDIIYLVDIANILRFFLEFWSIFYVLLPSCPNILLVDIFLTLSHLKLFTVHWTTPELSEWFLRLIVLYSSPMLQFNNPSQLLDWSLSTSLKYK